MPKLVVNPKDRFSCDKAHMISMLDMCHSFEMISLIEYFEDTSGGLFK